MPTVACYPYKLTVNTIFPFLMMIHRGLQELSLLTSVFTIPGILFSCSSSKCCSASFDGSVTVKGRTTHAIDPNKIVPTVLFQEFTPVPSGFRQPHGPAAGALHDLIDDLLRQSGRGQIMTDRLCPLVMLLWRHVASGADAIVRINQVQHDEAKTSRATRIGQRKGLVTVL